MFMGFINHFGIYIFAGGSKMDDIMILLHKMTIDVMSLNESHFTIFDDSERQELTRMFKQECHNNPQVFISMLSPVQKQTVTLWACERSSYDVKEVVEALKKFTKHLEGITYSKYPKPPKKKKSK